MPVTHPEFTTHSNYLDCVSFLSNGLSISINNSVPITGQMPRLVFQKKTLIELTRMNLNSELHQINNFQAYSQICVSWIPVKSYYFFFNLLILLEYLITSEEKWLIEDHGSVHQKLKDLIRNGSLLFNINSFNTIYTPGRIGSWVIPSGSNIRITNRNYNTLERQVVKKMLGYSMEEYKRVRGIKSLRGNARQNFLNSTSINLCDFFYWYRIKANYRDMEFVQSAVSINDFYSFYCNYFRLTRNFYRAMRLQINNISFSRFGRNIL